MSSYSSKGYLTNIDIWHPKTRKFLLSIKNDDLDIIHQNMHDLKSQIEPLDFFWESKIVGDE